MIHELVAERLGDGGLKRLDLLVLEFHHLARRQVDQMVVVLVGVFFVARPPVAEVMAFQQAALLEEADRAIDRRQADAGVDLGRGR